MNAIAYILYLIITYLITVKVGLLFYTNGQIFVLSILQGDVVLSKFINKILLILYYLLNLGYCALMLSSWHTINTVQDVVTSIVHKIGTIILTLAMIHYINIIAIVIYSKHKKIIHF